MAYYENRADAERMEQSRNLALAAIAKATEAVDVQGPGFERHAKLAAVTAALYDADVRRSKEHK